jgi:hypothetical protein
MTGQFAKAVPDWERASELSRPDERPPIAGSRALSLVRAGRVVEALAEVDELSKSPDTTAADWFLFACIYSIAGGTPSDNQEQHAERAVELLRRAVQAGFHDVERLKQDEDLEPLREREDFQGLLQSLDKQ